MPIWPFILIPLFDFKEFFNNPLLLLLLIFNKDILSCFSTFMGHFEPSSESICKELPDIEEFV